MSLSTKVKTAVMAAVLAIVGVGACVAMPAFALEEGEAGTSWQNGIDAAKGNNVPSNISVSVTSIINTVLYVVGLLAVVMVIIGGVKYTTSGGDQAQVTSAKNTILYGIVGLVIAVLAYAIVNFVIGKIGTE